MDGESSWLLRLDQMDQGGEAEAGEDEGGHGDYAGKRFLRH
jgi:hypothetical protein